MDLGVHLNRNLLTHDHVTDYVSESQRTPMNSLQQQVSVGNRISPDQVEREEFTSENLLSGVARNDMRIVSNFWADQSDIDIADNTDNPVLNQLVNVEADEANAGFTPMLSKSQKKKLKKNKKINPKVNGNTRTRAGPKNFA